MGDLMKDGDNKKEQLVHELSELRFRRTPAAADGRGTPVRPADWKDFTVHYRYRETVYHIAVLRASAGDTGDGKMAKPPIPCNCDTVPGTTSNRNTSYIVVLLRGMKWRFLPSAGLLVILYSIKCDKIMHTE
ncbi:MAG: hypothetical protein WC560_06270 [Syntrophales bacterium]